MAITTAITIATMAIIARPATFYPTSTSTSAAPTTLAHVSTFDTISIISVKLIMALQYF